MFSFSGDSDGPIFTCVDWCIEFERQFPAVSGSVSLIVVNCSKEVNAAEDGPLREILKVRMVIGVKRVGR